MNRIYFALLLLPFLLARSILPLAAQEKTYRDPGGAYSFSYPGYFDCESDGAKHTAKLFSKEKILSLAFVSLDAASFPGSNVQKLCKQFPMIEQMIMSAVEQQGLKVTSKSDLSFKGVPAISYGMGGNVKNVPLSGLCLTFINKKNMYMMFYFGRDSDKEQNEAIFNTVLKSFTM